MQLPERHVPHLDVTWPLDRVLAEAGATCDRRWLLLCDGGIDHVRGAVSPREVIAANASGRLLAELALPVWFAPDPKLSGAPAATDANPQCPLVVYVDEAGRTTGSAERGNAA